MLGTRVDCDDTPPTLTCDMVSFQLQPGICVEFQNPCGDHQWRSIDGFRLCEPPPGIYVQTQRNPRARFLCADANAGNLSDVPVDFFYVRPGNTGLGMFRVTVGNAMSVVVSANPTTISPGGSSQLTTSITGGTSPFSFSWCPSIGLDDSMIQNPIASPTTNTQYTVTVTDAGGGQASASVTISVGMGVQANATPSTIDPGGTSSLIALASGGVPPYTYAWSPAASLDNATIPFPNASPTNTTKYSVIVSDSAGSAVSGDVTVFVNLIVTATAAPDEINPGGVSQLGTIVQGGLPPYSFDWSPSDSLDDPSPPDPIATPSVTTQYTVVVTDSDAVVAMDSVTVTVLSVGLTACFTAMQTGFLPENAPTVEADATCSSGDIIEYRWWADYDFVGQPPTTTTMTPFATFLYEELGTMTLRLEVVDNLGATHATTLDFDVQ
jgi:hypothetical protein